MRKVRRLLTAFCTFVALLAVTSCSNEEETFFFDENGVPTATAQQRISDEQFKAMVNGNGWVETATHEIFSNGDYDKRDYWEGMDTAAGPSRYCLKGDTISEFIFLDCLPKMGSNVRRMRYDASTNTVYADNKMVLRIISVNNGWMQAVKLGGLAFKQRSKSQSLYFYVTLRRMSDAERKDIEEYE
ncbi:MAG: hypothetical protein PUC79_01735 [Prevotellaceae bacterium]|nr:hypothetical protein [Prevotellaceae bacterium]